MENKIEPEKVFEADYDRSIANSPKDHIKGWGIDANPQNNPTYPMKEWNGADHQRFNYNKPTQQPSTVEVLHSTERPGITRVFGTSTPPSGLSGVIRRLAFKQSESTWLRWVPLVLADRINVVEGYIDDLIHGIVPNPVAERGWPAEWKYNKKGVVKNLAIAAGVGAAIVLFLNQSNKKSKKRVPNSTDL